MLVVNDNYLVIFKAIFTEKRHDHIFLQFPVLFHRSVHLFLDSGPVQGEADWFRTNIWVYVLGSTWLALAEQTASRYLRINIEWRNENLWFMSLINL